MLPNIFYNNNIAWSGIAALVSFIASMLTLLGVMLNVRTQRKIAKQQIDANLKAKARIEWIVQVRELVSIYITELSKLDLTLEKMIKLAILQNTLTDGFHPPIKMEQLMREFDECIEVGKISRIAINEYSEKILLYFSEKEEHKKIETLTVEIPNKLSTFEALTDNNIVLQHKLGLFLSFQNELRQNISEIRSEYRKYFKEEWDKAKQGK